jgi:hypothetical protein
MAWELDENVLEEQSFVRLALLPAAQGEEQVPLDRGGGGAGGGAGRWHHDGLTIDQLHRHTPAGRRLKRNELRWLEMRVSDRGHIAECTKWASGLRRFGRAAEWPPDTWLRGPALPSNRPLVGLNTRRPAGALPWNRLAAASRCPRRRFLYGGPCVPGMRPARAFGRLGDRAAGRDAPDRHHFYVAHMEDRVSRGMG